MWSARADALGDTVMALLQASTMSATDSNAQHNAERLKTYVVTFDTNAAALEQDLLNAGASSQKSSRSHQALSLSQMIAKREEDAVRQ